MYGPPVGIAAMASLGIAPRGGQGTALVCLGVSLGAVLVVSTVAIVHVARNRRLSVLRRARWLVLIVLTLPLAASVYLAKWIFPSGEEASVPQAIRPRRLFTPYNGNFRA